jgi:hypothetical protein
MLSNEDKRAIHQLETDLLLQEEEKRHLLIREQALAQEERMLHNNIIRAEQELGKIKTEKAKISRLLIETNDAVQRLQTKIKTHR